MARHGMARHGAARHNTTQQHHTTQHDDTRRYTILHDSILHYTTLLSTTIYHTTLQRAGAVTLGRLCRNRRAESEPKVFCEVLVPAGFRDLEELGLTDEIELAKLLCDHPLDRLHVHPGIYCGEGIRVPPPLVNERSAQRELERETKGEEGRGRARKRKSEKGCPHVVRGRMTNLE